MNIRRINRYLYLYKDKIITFEQIHVPVMVQTYSGLGFETRILLFLLDNGRVVRRRFKEAGFGYPEANKALERLESVGLTKYDAVGDYRDTVYWDLTEKGLKVARTLKELDEFIRKE